MANQENQIIKWLNGELSDEEISKIIGAADLRKYKQITSEIDQWEPSLSEEYRVDLNEILNGPKTITRSLNWWKPLSIAASIALILTVSVWLLFFNSDTTTYYADAGETLEITLPDGQSKVTLAAASSLTVRRGDWKKGRRPVKLSGKALFDVEPGDPFTVTTDVGEVAVLGTTFTVDVFDQSMQVACFEGRVRATTPAGQVEVPGGESYLFHQGQWEDMIPVTGSGPSWSQNELSYTKAPLDQVIKALEKEYDITIEINGVAKDRRFTGSFPTDNLSKALKIVFDPLNIHYEIKGKTVYLSNN